MDVDEQEDDEDEDEDEDADADEDVVPNAKPVQEEGEEEGEEEDIDDHPMPPSAQPPPPAESHAKKQKKRVTTDETPSSQGSHISPPSCIPPFSLIIPFTDDDAGVGSMASALSTSHSVNRTYPFFYSSPSPSTPLAPSLCTILTRLRPAAAAPTPTPYLTPPINTPEETIMQPTQHGKTRANTRANTRTPGPNDTPSTSTLVPISGMTATHDTLYGDSRSKSRTPQSASEVSEPSKKRNLKPVPKQGKGKAL